MPDESFVIFDTEYTTWDGALQSAWAQPWQYREIVQIGAIRVDKNSLTEIDHFDVLTKPVKNPELSEFFTKLTGITNEALAERGIEYGTALQDFYDWCGETVAYSYGNDTMMMAETTALHDLHPYPTTETVYFCCITPFIRRIAPSTLGVHSGELANFLKLEIKGGSAAHNALHDCRSILATIKYGVEKKGLVLPF